MWMGIIGTVSGFLFWAWYTFNHAQIYGVGAFTFLSLLLGFVVTMFIILGMVFTTALYLLAVDAARNLRSIERKTGR